MNRQRFLDALPGTRKDIQERTGLSKTAVQNWATRLHKEGAIYISKWVKPTPNSIPTAYYRKGKGKDAPCRQQPLSNTERHRRYRQRMRQDGRWEFFLAKANARRWARRAEAGRRDPLMAALYGPARYQHQQ